MLISKSTSNCVACLHVCSSVCAPTCASAYVCLLRGDKDALAVRCFVVVPFIFGQRRPGLLHFLSFLCAPAATAFSRINHNTELLAQVCHFTNKGVEALWLIVPVDSQEIDRDAGQHDGQASATHHGLRVKREDEQEGPEDEVNDRPYQADLDWSVHVWLFDTQDNLPGNSNSIEEVVDEAHVVDESVHVAGAQHKQGGQASEEESRDGSAAFHVNHGQQTGEVALSGPSKEQP